MLRQEDVAQNGASNTSLKHEKYMDEVATNLWLGQYSAAFDDELPTLKKHDIMHIVSIGCYQDWWQFRKEPKHLLLPLEDTPFVFITDYFPNVFKFMDEALKTGHGVLVHCDKGRSRSGAIVIAYLMRKYRKQYPETLNQVLVSRKRVMPNIGFQIQLRAFAKQNWNTTVKYSDNIDIERELSNALKNLYSQVSKLQEDIRSHERILVTITKKERTSKTRILVEQYQQHKDQNWRRSVSLGLDSNDLVTFRKEWILLVFLCHQFQMYKMAVHSVSIHSLYTLGEQYFNELLGTFDDVFHPKSKYPPLILNFNDPLVSVQAAFKAHVKEAQEQLKKQTKG